MQKRSAAKESARAKTVVNVRDLTLTQKTVGVPVKDCGKEFCQCGRMCSFNRGDCPEEET